jgi:enoyl-CoA hydratase/carnithine racemase
VIGADEALAAGFLHDAVEAEAAEQRAIDLAASLGDVRQLKQMFRAYDGTEARVHDENARLLEFQRSGAGLPRRR